MLVYIFECSSKRDLYGATTDPSGANLPQDICEGGWRLFKQKNWNPGDKAIAVDVDELLAALSAGGTYVWGVSITTTVG